MYMFGMERRADHVGMALPPRPFLETLWERQSIQSSDTSLRSSLGIPEALLSYLFLHPT